MKVQSSVSNVVGLPVRGESPEHELIRLLATADDLLSGMTRVVERIRHGWGAARSRMVGAGPEVEITAGRATTLSLPPGPLRVVLRNLLSSAVSAGARFVHVAAERSGRSWCLSLDEDRVGLAEPDGFAAGSVLGLALCRRIAARFGGALELTPRLGGPRRATVEPADEAQ